jgi:amidase
MTEPLATLTAVELRRPIRTKEISLIALLEACITALEPAVNALAATGYARARAAARAAEHAPLRGETLPALHGLPTAIKDLHETAGLLTTYGSPLHRDFVKKRDAAMVDLVRKAGAVTVAMPGCSMRPWQWNMPSRMFPELLRPRPDTSKLQLPRPELKSIVTHSPILS